MIKQRINLQKWKWGTVIFYDAVPEDADYIMRHLERLNPPLGVLSAVRSMLSSGRVNEGITYSNYAVRKSLVVIGRADSSAEFFNTAIHEGFHLAKHICQCDGIDPFSEEAAYCMGDLCGEMLSAMDCFICE